MYDFYFGEKEDILKNELTFLISVKRMMPRWCNSIPDSEFQALFDDLKASNIARSESQGVIIETGCGASTIILAYFAFKHGKKLFTWDINQNKLSYIRSIICDTIEKVFRVSLHDVWTYIPYLSTSNELGIGILKEMDHAIDFAFFDSEHTAEVLMTEVDLALKLANAGAVFAFDDANYRYKYMNTAYINVFRKKLGLSSMEEPSDNQTDPFFTLAARAILKQFPNSEKIEDSYKKNFKKDIFWQYYANDRQIMNNLDMEKMSELEHRYDSYLVKP